MLELIICDDEKVYRNDLKRTLSTELDLSGIEYRICEFTSGEELLAKVSPADSQILFLDIEMADLNGIETAKNSVKINITDRLFLSRLTLILYFRDTKSEL